MTIPHILILISTLITVGGASLYIRDTLSGKSKPNLVSWSMWAIAPLIGTAAALSIGSDVWVTIRIFLAGFLPLLVVLASFFNPKSYWKLTPFDIACGVCSALAIALWIGFGGVSGAKGAILLAALGDGFAALPTIRKAWKFPETETGLLFVASLISTLLVLPSIQVWNIENSAFQVYLLIVNTILIFSIYKQYLFKIFIRIK